MKIQNYIIEKAEEEGVNISYNHLTNVISGRTNLSIDKALILSEITGTELKVWMSSGFKDVRKKSINTLSERQGIKYYSRRGRPCKEQ